MSFFNRDYCSPQRIILEAAFQKISFEDYTKILRFEDLQTIEDLKGIISDESYEIVELSLREAFCRQTVWYMAVFDVVMGIERGDDQGYREYKIDF